MSKDKVLEDNWSDFSNLIGLVDLRFDMDDTAKEKYFCIPYTAKPMKPNVLFDLYIQGRAVVGEQKNLLKVWDITHRIYYNTVAPRVGNFDQIHGRLIDIMHESFLRVGQGKKLDVMDIIWHVMFAVVMNRRVPIFGAHVMKLINHVWEKRGLDMSLSDNDEELTEHKSKDLFIKKHAPPLIPNVEESTSDDEDDPTFELPRKEKAQDKGFKKWLANSLKTLFCHQDDMDCRAYKEHKRRKEERHRTLKYFEHLGVPVVAGSEENITSFTDWVARDEHNPHRTLEDFEFQDDASSSQTHDPWTHGGDVPEASNRNNEIEEEESEEGDDEDEESDEELAGATSSEE